MNFAGLKPLLPAKKIKHIMGVNNVLKYVAQMVQYVPVINNFIMQEDKNTGTVTYWNKHSEHDVTRTYYNEYLDHFQHIFDIHTFNMSQQMEKIHQKVEACENTQRNHFANMQHTTQQITTSIISNP